MALALLLRRPTMLLLAAPYARRTAIGIRGLPRDQMPRILAGRITADAVTLAALARGSAVARTLVL
jgi:hypothetical protein